jgi:hypothetical protein
MVVSGTSQIKVVVELDVVQQFLTNESDNDTRKVNVANLSLFVYF